MKLRCTCTACICNIKLTFFRHIKRIVAIARVTFFLLLFCSFLYHSNHTKRGKNSTIHPSLHPTQNYIIPYSGKFLYGANFCIFHTWPLCAKIKTTKIWMFEIFVMLKTMHEPWPALHAVNNLSLPVFPSLWLSGLLRDLLASALTVSPLIVIEVKAHH